MDDAHVLPRTFAKWQKIAEETERRSKGQGVVTVRAIIDPDTFPAWCTIRGLHVDARCRMAFANERGYEAVKQTH